MMFAHLLIKALDEVCDVSPQFLVEPVPLRDLRYLRRQPLDLGLRREELVGGAVRVRLVPPVHLVHRLNSVEISRLLDLKMELNPTIT